MCEAIDGPMIEEYAFSFSYSSSDSEEVSMNVNRVGTKKGGTFRSNSTTEITPNQMRSSACKMVRTLIQLMRTLDKMPEEQTILMKLLYMMMSRLLIMSLLSLEAALTRRLLIHGRKIL